VVEIFSSGSADFYSIKARLKNKKQCLIDPEPVFNRDQDRDEIFLPCAANDPSKMKPCPRAIEQMFGKPGNKK